VDGFFVAKFKVNKKTKVQKNAGRPAADTEMEVDGDVAMDDDAVAGVAKFSNEEDEALIRGTSYTFLHPHHPSDVFPSPRLQASSTKGTWNQACPDHRLPRRQNLRQETNIGCTRCAQEAAKGEVETETRGSVC
jgi:hypothetical protein